MESVHATDSLSTTDILSRFIASTDYSELGRSHLDHIRRSLVDGVANAIAGASLRPAKLQDELIAEFGNLPQATILASGEKTSIVWAVYLNSVNQNMLDFDDTYQTFLHPGATSIPPALAIAEYIHASGKDVLTAIAVGYETQIRIAEACRPSYSRFQRVAGFASLQSFGSAAAAASLMELSDTKVAMALSAAAYNAPLPSTRKHGLEASERPYTWLKGNFGWAAMGGTFAVLLVDRGILCPGSVLESNRGLWAMVGSDSYDSEQITSDLGINYRLLGTSFKPYAACRWTHGILDCVSIIRNRIEDCGSNHSLDSASFNVYTSLELAQDFSNYPSDIIDAPFSIPFLVALEALNRSSQYGYQEDDLSDLEVVDLASRVAVMHAPEADEKFYAGKTPGHVICMFSDGTSEEVCVENAHGSPDYPLTDKELWRKWLNLMEPYLGRSRSDLIVNEFMAIDQYEDASQILNILSSECRGI